jgi:hypothetical protein
MVSLLLSNRIRHPNPTNSYASPNLYASPNHRANPNPYANPNHRANPYANPNHHPSEVPNEAAGWLVEAL